LDQTGLVEHVHVLGYSGWGEPQHLDDLTEAQLAVSQGQKGSQARFVTDGLGYHEKTLHD
jgi:hypothetical protein